MSLTPRRLLAAAVALLAASNLPAATSQAAGQGSPPSQVEGPAPAAPIAAAVPKNVIVLIGDGMGFNQLDVTSLYRDGAGAAQVGVDAETGAVTRRPGRLVQELAGSDVALAMRTTQAGGSYSPDQAWADFGYVLANPTDSAAAATAMATGVKTYNQAIGVGPDHKRRQNLSELAISTGRLAGVVTSVPFSHATPGGFSAHDTDRGDYHGIAHDQLGSRLSVVMGAGHPWYTDDRTRRSRPKYTYLSSTDYHRLTDGSSGFRYVSTNDGFADLTTGRTPRRVFGIARVGSTLQEKRSRGTEVGASRNNVTSLATMTKGALNVLDGDPDGFFLMVEGGAIDWANHENRAERLVEEGLGFLAAVDAVNDWVQVHSSWAETLVVVTADHESGYLSGAGADPDWTPITGTAGTVPAVSWHSTQHTRQLVPFFARGAGAARFAASVIGSDPVRGPYLDNTAVHDVVAGLWD